MRRQAALFTLLTISVLPALAQQGAVTAAIGRPNGLGGLRAGVEGGWGYASTDLGQKALLRLMSGRRFGVHALGAQPLARPMTTTITNDDWQGGAGNWNTAASWSTGTVPNSTNNAVLSTSTPAAVVQLNVNAIINNLTICATCVLNFNNNQSLTIDGTSISNAGTLALNSTGNFTELIVGSSNVTLSGGGTLTMSNNANANNYIFGSAGANMLTNINNTIQGSGSIGDNKMALVNQGTIDANQSTPLYVQTSNGLTNSGTLEATNGGTLILEPGNGGATNTGTIQTTASTLEFYGGTWANSQTIQNNAGTLQFEGGTVINGGAVNQTGAATMQLGNATINAPVTNSSSGTITILNNNSASIGGTLTNPAGGQVTIGNSAYLTMTGATLSNGGSIALNAPTGYFTELVIGSSNVTLGGGGTVMMSNDANITGAASADTLTNVDNTIQGSGFIGDNKMALVNQGTINANQPTLTVETSNGLTNSGTLEATNGGTLVLQAGGMANSNTGTIQTTASTLEFYGGTWANSQTIQNNAGTLQFEGGTVINGGAVNQTGAATMQLGNATINAPVTNSSSGTITILNNNSASIGGTLTNPAGGQVTIGNSAYLTMTGATLSNGGSIALNAPTGYFTELVIGSSNVTLGGGGTVMMSNDANITGAASADTLTNVDNTIQGSGFIGDNKMALVNQGTINANQPTLTVETSNGLTNSGTLEATNGGTLVLQAGGTANSNTGTIQTTASTLEFYGGTWANSQTIQNNAGTLQFEGGTVINGGAVNQTGAATMQLGNATINAPVTNSSSGTITILNNNSASIGTLTNPAGGQVNIGNSAYLTMTGATLSNGGSIALNAPTGYFTELVIGSSNVTLSGGGTVTMSNDANITGAASADTLTNVDNTIQGSGFIGDNKMALVNQGTINANQPTLTVETSNGLTNSGTLEATNGGTLVLQAGGTANSNTGTIQTTASTLEFYGGTWANSQTIQNNAGTLQFEGGTMINGGAVNQTGAATMQLGNATINAPVTNSSSGTITILNNNSASIGTLTNPAGGQVNIGNSAYLTMTGATLSNGGSIALNAPTGYFTELVIGSSNVTLSGGGTVTMSNDANITGAAPADTLTNVDNTIQGSGFIGDNKMALVNQGTINANQPTLTVETSNGLTNSGTLEATNGGTLVLQAGGTANSNTGTIQTTASTLEFYGGTWANSQTIQNNAGTLQFEGGTVINGGAVNQTGAATMQLGNATINAPVTNSSSGTITILNNNSASIGTLTNPAGGQVNIGNSAYLTMTGATLSNGGSIALNAPTGYFTELVIGSSNVTLSGGGTVTMSNDANITGAASADTLTNVNNTIQGSGFVGDNKMGFVNDGTVLANQSAPLTIQPSSAGFTNNGTLQANAGSTLDIILGAGTAFTNFNSATNTLTGGTYNVNGGTLEFTNANIVTNAANIALTGATAQIISGTGANALANFATNAPGGVFTLGPSYGTFATGGNFTNNGTLVIGAGDTFKVSGSLGNFSNSTLTGGTYYVSGTLQFGASGSSLTTNAANLTLAGTGAQLLNLSGANLLNGFNTNSGGVFTVAAGGSFTTPGAFTNSGTMDVEQASSLTVSGNLTNNGTVATNNQNLAGGANSITVTGTLTNNAGANVTIGANNDTSDIANVALLSNAGMVTVGSGATLKLTSAGTDTNTGTIADNGGTLNLLAGTDLDMETGGKLTVTGSLTNDGAITTNEANLQGAANAFTVTGTLTNNPGATVTLGAHGDTNDTASVGLLSNAGTFTVDKGAILKLTATGADSNTGTVALHGGTLSVQSGGAFTNEGTLDQENGGKLNVTGGLTNGGTLSTNGSNLGGAANSITVTGKLANGAGATVTIGANNDTADKATVGYLANAGTITVGTGAFLTLSAAATETNSGTIAVNGTLDINAATTLSGTGSLTITNGAITGSSAAPTFKNTSTIQGSGTISNLGITNAGVLSANQAAPLVILPAAAGLNNTGAILVGTGGTMQIGTSAGGALTNFANNTLTGGTYNLSGTLQFGAAGTTVATNAASITLNGAGQMLDFGNNNILAGFNNNASTGTFKLASGASLTTTGGSFTNAGVFSVGTGTTFTLGGSSFNFTQTGGSAVVNGTLTSTSLGTLAVNGGSLDGTGTLGYNVVDASTLTPGDSSTVTGKLTVADTYTQSSSGSLDIQINGATAGTKYDQLKVSQGATLGGTLNIALGTGFTPTVGETFTILAASSVSDTFANVNGLAINGSEHFTITYNAGSVVLTVVSGALPASTNMLSRLIHPALEHLTLKPGSSIGSRYGLVVSGPSIARLPATVRPVVPVASLSRMTPVSMQASEVLPATGMRGLHAMDLANAPVAPLNGPDASVSGAFGIAPISAASYNSMSAMNHQRFELGVDLKALLKTSRKQLLRALWASPDSPEALAIGYMTYTAAH